MKSLIEISKEVRDFPAGKKIPENCTESIFIPAFSIDCQHHYFWLDFKNKRITCWNVNLKKVKEQMKLRVEQVGAGSIPWNMDLESYLNGIYFAHSAEHYQGKIYLSFIDGNFLLVLDLHSDAWEVIYDPCAPNKIYGSTNLISDGQIYFSRWEIEDGFRHIEDDSLAVKLEIGCYDIEQGKFTIFDTIDGPDDIHTTLLTQDRKSVLILEMTQNPALRFPRNMEELTDEQAVEIQRNGLCESSLILYDLKNRSAHTWRLPAGPAHVEPDPEHRDLYYVSSHNLCSNKDKLYCFGTSRIDAVRIADSTLEYLGGYQSEDFYRSPSHKLFRYQGLKLMALAIYPNQVHIVDLNGMRIYKKITLSKSKLKSLDFSKGPYPYPPAREDKTPYTVHAVSEKNYLFLSNIWNVTLFDFVNEQKIESIVFNPNKSLIAMGHASKFTINWPEGMT